MNSIEFVWYNDDLRREIFSYLRKEPKVKCEQCDDVCVWDKKVLKLYYNEIQYNNRSKTYKCYECYWKNMLDLCSIS